MAVLATGTSVVGRQVLFSRGAVASTPVFLSLISISNVDYSLKGLFAVETNQSALTGVMVQGLTRQIWRRGVYVNSSDDQPSGKARVYVAIWKVAGITWQLDSAL